MIASIVVSSFFVLAFTIWLLFKISFNYWKQKNVYCLKPIIPFGNAFDMICQKIGIGMEMKNVYDYYKKKSLAFGGYYFFNQPIFIPVDLELIKRMASTDFEHFTDHTMTSQEYDPLTCHLFAQTGTKWKKLRNQLSPAFTASKNKMMFDTVKNYVKQLVEMLESISSKKEAINIHDLASRLSIDVISSCAFGIDCNSLTNPNSEVKQVAAKFFAPSTRNVLVTLLSIIAPKLLKTFRIRFISKDISDFFINITNQTVNYRETNKVVRKDFVHLLLQIKNNVTISDDFVGTFEPSGKASLTIEQIAAQSFVIFTGGFETVCGAITFCLYEMSLNLEIQEMVRSEISNALVDNDEKYTYELLQKLPYLEKCIYETFRKYPVAPVLVRQCTKDYIISDTKVHLEKGSFVFVPTLGIHTDPEYYPDPEKFDPERFSKENVKNRNPYAFIPFGFGPRTCIAYSFGLMEMKITLAMLLSKYRFTLDAKTKQPLELSPKTIIMMPKHDIWLNVESI